MRPPRPWCTRAAFTDRSLAEKAPGVWPGAEGHTRGAVWVVVGALISGIGFGAPALAWCAVRGVPRVERRVIATRGRLCPFCGHDLTGRPLASRLEASPCPECGRPISTRDAVLFWCRQLRRSVKP